MNVKYLDNRTCWEVEQILEKLGYTFIHKLPTELYQEIKNKSEKNMNKKYMNISRKTIVVIATLHSLYWADTLEEHKELENIFIQNEKKYQEELRKKLTEDIFVKQKTHKANIEEKVNNKLIVPKEEKWYERIWKRIKKFIHK